MANNKIFYSGTTREPIFYKDIFILYRDIIREAVKDNGLKEDIVMLVNNDLINVNRAPLIVLTRIDSPQPAAINNINETIGLGPDGEKVINGAANYSLNLAITSYGNTYIEAERLGSIIQQKLITTSIHKVRKKSNNSIMGHMFLGWSGTNFLSSNSKLMSNRIDIKIQMVLDYITNLEE